MNEQKAPADQQEQLDAVLDAALDELDDDKQQDVELETKGSPAQKQEAFTPRDELKSLNSKPVYGPEEPPEFDMGSFDDVMKQMFQGDGDPEAALDSFMKQLQSQLASELQGTEAPKSVPARSVGKPDKCTDEKAGASPSTEPPSDNDVDRTISKLLNDMATAGAQDDGASHAPEDEEEMFQNMMKELEKMGNGTGGAFDQDAVVDGMMQQLLSKDIMYEPMKQVTERFPCWLEANKQSLSEEEFHK